jgi:hypothetical protein
MFNLPASSDLTLDLAFVIGEADLFGSLLVLAIIFSVVVLIIAWGIWLSSPAVLSMIAAAGITISLILGILLTDAINRELAENEAVFQQTSEWLEENYDIPLTEDAVQELVNDARRGKDPQYSDVRLDDGRVIALQRSQQTGYWKLYEVSDSESTELTLIEPNNSDNR